MKNSSEFFDWSYNDSNYNLYIITSQEIIIAKNPEILISAECLDDYTNLTVKDNGIGIDLDKFKEDLFGLYKTFHNNPEACLR